jgi:RimJ/RimL family protein N-acetyltransferase
MLNHQVHDLASERQKSLLAEAEAAARARQARRAGQPAVLRDGSAVLIRQVRGDDAALLADGFARLSEQSRQMRFLVAKKILTHAELRYLTEVDHHDHEALGALADGTDMGVGIARYIRDNRDPRSAEVAVTVVDDWHRRGLGTELLNRLSERARTEGIGRFTALVATDNMPAARLLRKMHATLISRDFDAAEYELTLDSKYPRGRVPPGLSKHLAASRGFRRGPRGGTVHGAASSRSYQSRIPASSACGQRA